MLNLRSAAPLAALLRPAVQTDALQVAKAVAAGTGAWVLAPGVLNLASPYLAPWTALLAVHATVYRSLSRGAQSVAAAVIGVLLAYAAESVLGGGTPTLALVLLVGLVVARVPGLRTEGVAVATTSLFVLPGARPTTPPCCSSGSPRPAWGWSSRWPSTSSWCHP